MLNVQFNTNVLNTISTTLTDLMIGGYGVEQANVNVRNLGDLENLIKETLQESTASIRYQARKKPVELLLTDRYGSTYLIESASVTEDGLVLVIKWALNSKDYEGPVKEEING